MAKPATKTAEKKAAPAKVAAPAPKKPAAKTAAAKPAAKPAVKKAAPAKAETAAAPVKPAAKKAAPKPAPKPVELKSDAKGLTVPPTVTKAKAAAKQPLPWEGDSPEPDLISLVKSANWEPKKHLNSSTASTLPPTAKAYNAAAKTPAAPAVAEGKKRFTSNRPAPSTVRRFKTVD